MKNFLKDNFGIWYEKPEMVKIRFNKTVRASIEGRIWHPSQSLKELKSGDIVLTMRVGITEELIAWVLRWGPYAVVMSPKSLRERVKSRLEESLKTYEQMDANRRSPT